MRIRIPVLDGLLCVSALVLLAYMLLAYGVMRVQSLATMFAPNTVNPLHLLALLVLLIPRVLLFSAKRRATGVRRVIGYVAAGLIGFTALTTATHSWLLAWPAILRWDFPHGTIWPGVLLALGAFVFFTSPARRA